MLRYFDQIKMAADGVAFRPIRVLIYPTDLCNYDCPWCESERQRANSVKTGAHTLSESVCKEAIRDAALMGVPVIHFSGGGEPMLHPQFGHLVMYAKLLGLKVAIDTNGSQLSWWHDALLYADNIRVSLNASTHEQYDAQTGVRGKFDNVLSAIKRLTAEPKRPEIGLSFVVSECNRESDFERVRKEVGADYLFVREERGEAQKPKANHCWFAKTICEIAPSGDVHACCDRRDIVFGNLYENRLRDIWGSARHLEEADKIVPSFCRKCLCDNHNEAVERFVIRDEARSWLV